MIPKMQTCSYKINKSWECNVQDSDYGLQYCIIYLKIIKRIDLKSSHHNKKILIMYGDGC